MIAAFEKLTDSEMELMLRAPLLTCILIAGADNDIDRKEIQEAIHVARKKANKSKASLMEFYRLIGEDFEDKLKIVLQSYPVEATQRNPLIIEELTMLNSIFPKLSKTFASEFYSSLKEVARKIASSSGGLLGLRSIGQEEARYVNLPMIKDPSH
jgi:superfamily I DNA/RNA helicase